MSWLQIKKIIILKSHLLLFYATTKNYFWSDCDLWERMEKVRWNHITIYKIYSQWEFAVWLKELKPGLGNNLVKGCCYEWMTLGLLASGREEFIAGPVTRLHWSELLCNKVLLKRERESFWLTSEWDRKSPPLLVFSKELYTYCC